MIQNKTAMILLLGVTFLLVACQAPPETPTTTTPQIPIETPTTPVETAQGVTVNGEPVPAQRIQEVQMQLGQLTGQEVTMQEARQYIIEETLLLQEAERRGLTPSQAEVDAEIDLQLTMQGLSREELEQSIGSEEFAVLVEQQQSQMSIQALQEDLAPQPTEEEIAEVYEQNRELFDAEGVTQEQAREDIIAFLAQAQSQEALVTLLDELLETAEIQ